MNFWNKNESILFSYMCVMGIFELLNYYLNSTMTTESKISNLFVVIPTFRMICIIRWCPGESHMITVIIWGTLFKNIKNLIWLITYLHVLLIIKRNTKFKSMEFKWFCYGTITGKISMYALLNICIYYIYICNYCTFDFLIWHWNEA